VREDGVNERKRARNTIRQGASDLVERGKMAALSAVMYFVKIL